MNSNIITYKLFSELCEYLKYIDVCIYTCVCVCVCMCVCVCCDFQELIVINWLQTMAGVQCVYDIPAL